jgi:hypothetical protein
MKALDILSKVFNKNNREYIFLTAFAIVCMLWLKSCSDQRAAKAEMEKQATINDQNMRAKNDTIRIVKNKAGELESVKSSYVSKLSDLEKINKDLYAEIKKEKGTTRAVIKSYVSVSSGDIVISNELKRYSDGITYGLEFADEKIDSGMTWHIKGVSKFQFDKLEIIPGTTEIFENQMKLKIVLGFTTAKNGDYQVFARSASPNVKFDELDGVLIIPKKNDDVLCPPAKKKRFGLGVQIGYGANIVNKQVFIGPNLSFGISYNIISF